MLDLKSSPSSDISAPGRENKNTYSKTSVAIPVSTGATAPLLDSPAEELNTEGTSSTSPLVQLRGSNTDTTGRAIRLDHEGYSTINHGVNPSNFGHGEANALKGDLDGDPIGKISPFGCELPEVKIKGCNGLAPVLDPRLVRDFNSFVHEVIEGLKKNCVRAWSMALTSGLGLTNADDIKPNNLWLEFGAAHGSTARQIANRLRVLDADTNQVRLHSFDSFWGLPDIWKKGFGDGFKPGSFSKGGKPPFEDPYIQWEVGLFNQTLPPFVKRYISSTSRIAFLHVDPDIYSAAHTIFTELGPYIGHGTIIPFHELVNYPKYREGELLALWEWFSGPHGQCIELLGGPAKDKIIEDYICTPSQKNNCNPTKQGSEDSLIRVLAKKQGPATAPMKQTPPVKQSDGKAYAVPSGTRCRPPRQTVDPIGCKGSPPVLNPREVPDFKSFEQKVVDGLKKNCVRATSSALNAGLDLTRPDDITAHNLWLEFGAAHGATARTIIARLRQLGADANQVRLHSFDSFWGLPEIWKKGYGDGFKPGSFSKGGKPPFEDSHVQWEVGLFNQTLPPFIKRQFSSTSRIAFLHVDPDIYSAAHTIFTELGPYIGHGTIIPFHELVNYPNYMEGELLALWEWFSGPYGQCIELLGTPAGDNIRQDWQCNGRRKDYNCNPTKQGREDVVVRILALDSIAR